MGQQITVSVREGIDPQTRIFDLNRSLTGMGIERYQSVSDIKRSRPADVLAKRLFRAGARSVTVYSSSVGVTAPAERWAELEGQAIEIIQNLFGFYGDDAGWDPDALRALGFEPLPIPEPAG
ncbi:MAG: hypothetical protein U0W40_05540 [Acidimicrobiia bacterium]